MNRSSKLGFAVVLASSMANAAPTTRESVPNNPNPNVSVFRDSLNPLKVWVAPPRVGQLRSTQEALSVDPDTCEQVTVLGDTRLARLQEVNANQQQITSIETLKTTMIADAAKSGSDPAVLLQQLQQWDAILAPLIQRRGELAAENFDLSIPDYLKQSGGYYTFLASVDWPGAIEQLKTANPNYDVQNLLIQDGNVAINGLGVTGFQASELIINVEAQSLAEMVNSVDAFQVEVHMTRIGACFLKYPEIMKTDVDPLSFGTILSYSYPLSVHTVVTAEYNLSSVYNYLSTKGSSGGFFSSKSWSSVREDSTVDSMMKITVTSEENLTEAQKEEERRYAREMLLNMAVSQMTAKVVPPGAPGATGAAQAAQALQTACGANVYCQGASVGLTILNGIFGSGQSRAELSTTLNDTRSFTSEATDTVTMVGSVSFVAGN